jgi:hypothetical protein
MASFTKLSNNIGNVFPIDPYIFIKTRLQNFQLNFIHFSRHIYLAKRQYRHGNNGRLVTGSCIKQRSARMYVERFTALFYKHPGEKNFTPAKFFTSALPITKSLFSAWQNDYSCFHDLLC